MTPKSITFESFKNQWLEDIYAGDSSAVILRQKFAQKLFAQWLELSESQEEWTSSDELSELGIDLIFFEAEQVGDNSIFGNTWYLVKSCFENALHPTRKSIFEDGKRILELLDNIPEQLPSSIRNLIVPIQDYVLKSLDTFTNNRLVLVFATEKPLSEKQVQSLEELISFGRSKLGPIFDVEVISIKTIYLNVLQEDIFGDGKRLSVPISVTASRSAANLLVGTIKLPDLYLFLRTYRLQTGNLDQLFERNVRRFLGTSGPINKAMQNTLIEDPAQFGLYNNGITLVVEEFTPEASDQYRVYEPYIVNGCQTTRTIWEVFRQKYEAGRHGVTPEIVQWRKSINDGLVVIKIVRVGDTGDTLLHNITRYTNSQNAVSEEDFLTLEEGFHRLKIQMSEKYHIFLEVQRGGWESQLALQKANLSAPHYKVYANAFELLKIYGSGWLGKAGVAFSSNRPFLPGGEIYQRIILENPSPFDADDLYAAYLLSVAAEKNGFGRSAHKNSRKLTRYLFYMIAVELLRDVLIRAELPVGFSDLSAAVIRTNNNQEAWDYLIGSSLGAVDEYLTQGEEESIFNEPFFNKKFNSDLNSYLKWEGVGDPEQSPRYASMMGLNKRIMGRGNPCPRDIITSAVKHNQ